MVYNKETGKVKLLDNNRYAKVTSSTPYTVEVSEGTPADEKFYLTEVAHYFLTKEIGKRKVRIVSIAGPYRKGKSYLISKAMNGSPNAFALGHTTQGETRGIWIGTFIKENSDGSVTLFIDAEGLFDPSNTDSRDFQIITLVILLSSLFIFNTDLPSKSNLNMIQLALKLHEKIRIHHGDKNSPKSHEMKEILPRLLWVVRDSFLIPTVQGKQVSFKEYMLDLLTEKDDDNGFDKIIQKENKVKRSFTNFFASLDFIDLPAPTSNATILQNVESHEDKLEPAFLAKVDEAVTLIHSLTSIKHVGWSNKTPCTGELLAVFAKVFVDCTNDPKFVPAVASVTDLVEHEIATRAHKECLEMYKKEFSAAVKDLLPMDVEQLTAKHKEIFDKLMPVFTQSMFMATRESMAKHTIALSEAIFKQNEDNSICKDCFLYHVFEENNRLSEKMCSDLANSLFEPLKIRVVNGDPTYKFEQFQADIKKFEQDYMNQAKGPLKNPVITNFMNTTVSQHIQFFKGIDQIQSQRAEAELKAEVTENALKAEQERCEALEKAQAEVKAQTNQHIEKILDQQKEMQEQMMKQRQADEKRHFEMTKKMMKNAEKQQENTAALFKSMQNQQSEQMTQVLKSSQENVAKMVEAIKNIPPPQVHVDGGGGCSVM